MRVRILLATGVAAPVLAVVVGLVSGPASSQSHWPGWFNFLRSHPWPSLLALTVASVAAASLATWPDRRLKSLAEAADELAEAVGRDWSEETRWRKIFDPYPLNVMWDQAESTLVPPWKTLIELAASRPGRSPSVDRASWARGPANLASKHGEIAGILDRVPTGRLVVLGEKGTGKSIFLMRLALDLLARRSAGGPIPVIFPLASWNPDAEDVQTWMANWLINDRAGLAGLAHVRNRVTLAEALIASGRILPILDGLDEIPVKVRGAAVARINDWMEPSQNLVIACRTSDYHAAVHPPNGASILLTGAAGIELLPLPVGDVIKYLMDSDGAGGRSGRWDGLAAAIASRRPPLVSQVLTTPLMASLARVAYNPRPGEDAEYLPDHPSELLNTSLFADPKMIEDHLYDRFVPASYRRRPDSANTSRHYAWNAAQAERWIIFLARNLENRQGGSTNVAWWNIKSAVPNWIIESSISAVIAFAVAIGFPWPSFGVGLFATIVTGLAANKWLSIGRRGLMPGLVGGVAGGVAGGLAAFLGIAVLDKISASDVGQIVGGGLAAGFCASAFNGISQSFIAGFAGNLVGTVYLYDVALSPLRDMIMPYYHFANGMTGFALAIVFMRFFPRNIPATGFRWSSKWFATGFVSSPLLGTLAWMQVSAGAGLIVGTVAIITSAMVAAVGESVDTDLAGGASPDTVLRRDRRTFIVSWLGPGAAFGLAVGVSQSVALNVNNHEFGVLYGARIGATDAVVIGVVFAIIQSSYLPYMIGRFYLAMSRKIPWRFMTFLRDAHSDRGVLRQVGAVYQFRHVELQRRLASRARETSTGVRHFRGLWDTSQTAPEASSGSWRL